MQRRLLAEVLDRLAGAGKLLLGTRSQHGSDWPRRKAGDDPIKDLYLDREVPFFDSKAVVELVGNPVEYRILLGHDLPGHSNTPWLQRRIAHLSGPALAVPTCTSQPSSSYTGGSAASSRASQRN